MSDQFSRFKPGDLVTLNAMGHEAFSDKFAEGFRDPFVVKEITNIGSYYLTDFKVIGKSQHCTVYDRELDPYDGEEAIP